MKFDHDTAAVECHKSPWDILMETLELCYCIVEAAGDQDKASALHSSTPAPPFLRAQHQALLGHCHSPERDHCSYKLDPIGIHQGTKARAPFPQDLHSGRHQGAPEFGHWTDSTAGGQESPPGDLVMR